MYGKECGEPTTDQYAGLPLPVQPEDPDALPFDEPPEPEAA